MGYKGDGGGMKMTKNCHLVGGMVGMSGFLGC